MVRRQTVEPRMNSLVCSNPMRVEIFFLYLRYLLRYISTIFILYQLTLFTLIYYTIYYILYMIYLFIYFTYSLYIIHYIIIYCLLHSFHGKHEITYFWMKQCVTRRNCSGNMSAVSSIYVFWAKNGNKKWGKMYAKIVFLQKRKGCVISYCRVWKTFSYEKEYL